MEDQTIDVDRSEETSDAFLCCVCLDLLYKPIVLSCGHISCFWCIHASMNGLRESHCPICRHPYYHFPTVCQMLHVVLLKMYPVAYKRRENQTLEEEKKRRIFSPQFDSIACGLDPKQESNHLSSLTRPFTASSQPNLCSDPRDNRNGAPCANTEQSESSSLFQDGHTTKFNESCKGNTEVIKVGHSKEENLPQNNPDGNHKQVLLADVLCAACNQLLFHPVVFNCGHVYCETCVIIPAEGKLMCLICPTMHPSGSPKVCLELDHFLEKEFPEEYSLRRVSVQLKQACSLHESSPSCSTAASKIAGHSTSLPTKEYVPWWSDDGSKVHIGVGCDFCGMYPILGDRYRCKDCVEKIGFDLCGECYNTRSKLPGRFNQQHTSEHQFELLQSNTLRNLMLRLVTDHLDNGSAASILSGDASENPDNGSLPPPIVLGDTRENAESVLVIPDASNDTEGDDDDMQSA